MTCLPQSRASLGISTFEGSLSEANSCDLRRLSFIDAYGLVGTACALRAASAEDQPELFLPDAPAMQGHLAAMGFRDFLTTSGFGEQLPAVPAIAAPDVVVPLQSAVDSGGAQALSNLLWEQLRNEVAPQVLHAITEGVWEMVANALEHSGVDALIMGQVYRTPRGTPPDHDDRVQIVIGDTGQGIRESFLRTGTHTPASDVEAIHIALEYLATSVPDDPGRGQGLFTTMEQVLETQGRMIVRSGNARVSITGAGRVDEEVPRLPGTLVALSFPLYPG